MESHIDRILRGEVGRAHSVLTFPEEKLELTVFPNEDTEGVFHVLSDRNSTIDGMIVPSEPRMVCDSVTVEAGKAEVHFHFHSKGLEEGSIVKGDIAIISEEGEYRLPFSVSVVMKYPDSSQGTIKNLFHFTNLARNHFDEAVNVFYSPEMSNIFKGQDKRTLNLYKAFSLYPDSGVNVEQYLIAVHKKSPVIFTIEPDIIEITEEAELNKTLEIKIRKSGWGYLKIQPKTSGDFIKLEKDVIGEKDFEGDTATVGFTIDKERLHKGANRGGIILRSFNSEIATEVCVNISPEWQKENNALQLSRQKNIKALIKDYIDFRTKVTDLAVFSHKAGETCEKMTDEDPRDILPRLIMTHLYLMQGRDYDASLMLSLIENECMLGEVHHDAEGYYDYLKALHKKENSFTEEMSCEVKRLHTEYPGSRALLWCRIYLEKELEENAVYRLELLDRQFMMGARSPLLYIEVLRALTEKGGNARLSRLSEVYALHWGVKNNIYYESMVSAMISLSYGIKGYSPILLEVLKSYFNRYGSLELLEAVCTMLIRERGGKKRNKDDFRWFDAGVRYGLKITRLYESYLNTFPDDHDELMPEPVLMYFSLGAGIGNDRMALFYASLIRHKDKVKDILKSNEQRITTFAVIEAENGRISENLAVIYEYVAALNIKELSNRFMLAVSPLVFCHEISVDDPDVKVVSSVESGFQKEHFGKVTNGKALLNLYGGENELILEYDDMRRSVVKKGVRDRALLNPAVFVKAIRFGIEKDPGQAFYVLGSGRHTIQVNSVNERSVRIVSESAEMDMSLRNECYFALIRYYSDNDRFDELDKILDGMDISEASVEVRAEIARLYVSRGMHRNVYSLIKEYGSEGVDTVILVRLVSRMIGDGINTEDPCLLNLSWEALKQGKYDENILSYLCSEFHGTIKDLRDVWKAASAFGIDTVQIEERILSQMLFAGSFTSDRNEILLSCIKNGGRERIISACLDYISHEYFVYKNLVPEKIFDALYLRYTDNDEMSEIASLALLKHYSEEEFRDEEKMKVLSPLVEELIRKGVVFEFFREYREYAPSMALYHDRTFVEYRAEPDRRVVIHYLISDDETADSDFMDLNMDEVYPGVYSSEFILFYGESLQYYITEEDGESMDITESEELTRDLTHGGRTDSRYDMINDMLLSESVKDDPSLEDLMEQYVRLSETVEEFF